MRSYARSARRILAAAVVGAVASFGVVAVTAGPAAAEPVGYAIEIADEGSCRLNQVDLATASLTPIGGFSADSCVGDLAFGPDGTLYGLRHDEIFPEAEVVVLVRFDTTTGATTDLGRIDAGLFIALGGLTFDTAGAMFAHIVSDQPGCGGSAVCLYAVDPADPESATFIGTVSQQETEYFGLATSCANDVVSIRRGDEPDEAAFGEDVAPDEGGDTGAVEPAQGPTDQILTTVDLATGATTDVGPLGELNFVLSLDFDTAGGLWGVGGTPAGFQVFSIDPATGAATPGALIGEGETRLDALAIQQQCTPSPEPVVLQPTFTG